MTACDSSVPKSSCFYKEVTGLPVLHSLEELYTRMKGSSRALNTGLAVIEYSVSSLFEKVFASSTIAARVDSMAGEGVSRLKERYPALQTSPEEIRDHTSYTMKKTVRGVMKSQPGRMLIRGLDWALDTSEGILKRMRPRDRSPRKRKMTRSSLQKQVHLTKEHAYASEDSGACEADRDSVQVHKSQQTMLTAKSNKDEDLSVLQKAYRMGIVFPLEVLVQVLKSVRRYAGGRRQKQSVKSLTPEKKIEICSRRKISPRKKMTSTFLGKLKQKTYMLLGYKNVQSINLGKAMEITSPDRDEAEKKRKHDEILTDEGSETDEDMANFDYENYDSEEDPDYEDKILTDEGSETDEDMANFDYENYDSEEGQDYEPDSAEESEDSESEDDDAESDIELEVVKNETNPAVEFVQLKEKQKDAALIPKEEPHKSAPEVGKPANKDEISLKPQWQQDTKLVTQKRKSLDDETKSS